MSYVDGLYACGRPDRLRMKVWAVIVIIESCNLEFESERQTINSRDDRGSVIVCHTPQNLVDGACTPGFGTLKSI